MIFRFQPFVFGGSSKNCHFLRELPAFQGPSCWGPPSVRFRECICNFVGSEGLVIIFFNDKIRLYLSRNKNNSEYNITAQFLGYVLKPREIFKDGNVETSLVCLELMDFLLVTARLLIGPFLCWRLEDCLVIPQ